MDSTYSWETVRPTGAVLGGAGRTPSGRLVAGGGGTPFLVRLEPSSDDCSPGNPDQVETHSTKMVNNKPMENGCVPFIVLQFLVLIILFFWQDLALYLPNLMLANK